MPGEVQVGGQFQNQYAQYQAAQSRVQEEGQQLAESQYEMNQAMGAYAQQQMAATQPMPGTSGTWMGSTHPGMSAVDGSPIVPTRMAKEAAKSKLALVKLQRSMKEIVKSEDHTLGKETHLEDFVQVQLQGVKDDILEENRRLTDDIEAGYHDLAGPRGPPGVPGADGRNGLDAPPHAPSLASRQS